MKALNSQSTGTVLWWFDRNENGIIVDEQGNEHYFDRSTWKGCTLPMRIQLLS